MTQKKMRKAELTRKVAAARALALKAEQRMKLAETARKHLQMLKAEQKQARKAFKQAKKAAKRARKEAKAASLAVKPELKSLERKNGLDRKRPARSAEPKKARSVFEGDLSLPIPLSSKAGLQKEIGGGTPASAATRS